MPHNMCVGGLIGKSIARVVIYVCLCDREAVVYVVTAVAPATCGRANNNLIINFMQKYPTPRKLLLIAGISRFCTAIAYCISSQSYTIFFI